MSKTLISSFRIDMGCSQGRSVGCAIDRQSWRLQPLLLWSLYRKKMGGQYGMLQVDSAKMEHMVVISVKFWPKAARNEIHWDAAISFWPFQPYSIFTFQRFSREVSLVGTRCFEITFTPASPDKVFSKHLTFWPTRSSRGVGSPTPNGKTKKQNNSNNSFFSTNLHIYTHHHEKKHHIHFDHIFLFNFLKLFMHSQCTQCI